ncbi:MULTISPECIES: hypothetical protein [Leclercia]|uniref:hypothetical protein n=1 Tax=Leclercia TaxID=83654 RepID=UPI001C703407|nr:hypothetical protein [Leclercia sp. EC_58]MBW9398643.1 hypothetical protein [Leclercia sp. EC_58]
MEVREVVNNIDFVYSRATGRNRASLQLPANIADVEAVCGGSDILSAWIIYQFAIPDSLQGEIARIRRLFVAAMKEIKYTPATQLTELARTTASDSLPVEC